MSIFATIASEAAEESELWGSALCDPAARVEDAIFSPLAPEPFRLALESIYEGYLLHYGRPRLFAPDDAGAAILLGDYLYAHGLVRLTRADAVGAVADCAGLISVCAQLRAEARLGDGLAWAATSALIADADTRLARARAALRLERDLAPLEALAIEAVGERRLEGVLGSHEARIADRGDTSAKGTSKIPGE